MKKELLGFSFLSALLYVLATPPIDIWPLGWLVLAPLLYAVYTSTSLKSAFFCSLFAGLAASFGLYYWLTYTMMHYGGLPVVLSFLLFLLLALYLALFWGVFGFSVKYVSIKMPSLAIISVPFFWVALEYLRTYLFSGFPWALLGYTQYKNVFVIQLADTAGVYGISFILALSSALAAEGVKKYLSKRTIPHKEITLLIISAAIPLLYGVPKIYLQGEPERDVVAALIQGNIEQDMKWSEGVRDKTIEIYRSLSKEAAIEAGKPDVMVWPETAVPFYFQQPGKLREEILSLSHKTGSSLVFGSPAYKLDGRKINYLNSAYLVTPVEKEGQALVAGRYDKIHLVPFGEYVPLKKLLFFVNKITEGIGDFSPGDGVMTLDVSASQNSGSEKIYLGPLICYEGIFPNLVRQFVGKGANVLVNITNDAWYGKSSAPYQHLSAAVFRSVENGVFMLRAANTGISAIVDPLGRIEKSTGLFERGYITGRIYLPKVKTLYSRFGDIFAIIVSALSVLILVLSYKKQEVSG